jgi:uncharacterized protein YjbJ (UPF0337 family)
MNWDQIEGQWHQLKGHAKSRWAKLTDDDVDNIAGKRTLLLGKLQTRYGVLKDEAEKQVDAWITKFARPPEAEAKTSDEKDKGAS